MTSELDATGGGASTPVDSSVCGAGISVTNCDDVCLIPKVRTSSRGRFFARGTAVCALSTSQ